MTEAELVRDARRRQRELELKMFGGEVPPGENSVHNTVRNLNAQGYGSEADDQARGQTLSAPAAPDPELVERERQRAEAKKTLASMGRSALTAVSPFAGAAVTAAEGALGGSSEATKALSGQEAGATADAAGRADAASVEGQTQAQKGAAAQAELDRIAAAARAGAGGRVLGYTKGGMVPSGATQQVSTEQKLRNPGYEDAVDDYLQTSGASAEGRVSQETELLRLAQEGSRTRQSQLSVQAWADRKAQQEEDAGLVEARGKIDSAMEDFKKSKPELMTYSDIWNANDSGGKILMGLGLLAGAFGGAKGGGNAFLNELDRTIERKLDIQMKQSEIAKAGIGQAQTAYETLRARFRDRNVTRKALHAIYLQTAEEALREQANAIGIGATDARLLALLEPVAAKKVALFGEVTGTLSQQSAESQKYNPPRAIIAAGDNLPKDVEEETQAYLKARGEAGLPAGYSAITLMKTGAERLGARDRGLVKDLIRRGALTNPRMFALVASKVEDPEAFQRVITGANQYVQSLGGKALTAEEAIRYTSGIIGGGSREEVLRGADVAKERLDAEEKNLHARYPRGYKIGQLRLTRDAGGDQPHEYEGQVLEPDLRKPVTPN